jgi:capsular polysaccharide biosynthesis protein
VDGARRRLARLYRKVGAQLLSKAPALAPKGPGASRYRGLPSWFAARLAEGSDRAVVLLADSSRRAEVTRWMERFPSDHVHLISDEAAPEWEVEEGRAAHYEGDSLFRISRNIGLVGPVDILVDLLPDELLPDGAANHHDIWRRLFFHVKPHGLYVIDRTAAPRHAVAAASKTWLQVLATAEDPDAERPISGGDRELVYSTDELFISRDLIVTTKRVKHYVKLVDAETNRVLSARDRQVRVRDVARLPAGETVSKATVISHESAVPVEGLSERMQYPPLHLRHYEGRVAFVGSTLMHTDYTILPDSFRHHLVSTANPVLKDVSPMFARIPANQRPQETLTGDFYSLDCAYSGHFGHLTTEVISRLWGWDSAKQEIPDLKAIFRIRHPNERDPVLERTIFGAYGIAESDIVAVDRPVYLRSVVSPTPMWHNSAVAYVHPGLRDVWHRLGENLIDRTAPVYDRIFISRGGHLSRRQCRNAGDVEQFFAARGFEVIHPEQLSLAQQAGIFAGATAIAGFAGSAMFNLMFAERVQTVILLSHEAYTARNEHLFTSLIGGEVHYFWSPPEIPHPEGGRSKEAFRSAWSFDFERNQKELEAVLESL